MLQSTVSVLCVKVPESDTMCRSGCCSQQFLCQTCGFMESVTSKDSSDCLVHHFSHNTVDCLCASFLARLTVIFLTPEFSANAIAGTARIELGSATDYPRNSCLWVGF
ncbi:unnamed protein product [Candidula unifasciata]|uniref:Uncharacterized protein n=1 Tax=Candidula unifasciata TaxID=100452 RepID=A0A8S3Z7D1_9EUPU|nr:unnamed protein product [Candidula unifasciata]